VQYLAARALNLELEHGSYGGSQVWLGLDLLGEGVEELRGLPRLIGIGGSLDLASVLDRGVRNTRGEGLELGREAEGVESTSGTE